MTASLAVITLLLMQASPPAGKQERPIETEAKIDRVRGLAPEFAADLLLRMASSPAIADRAWKIELIDEAFATAANAQIAAPWSGSGNTDSRYGRTYAPGLDRITLQLNAVESMLGLDAVRALGLFRSIRLPELKPVSCEEMVVERPGRYYELVPKLFTASFSAQQRRRGDDAGFVSEAIRSMRAHAQIEPVADMLRQFQAPVETRQQWFNEFTAALRNVTGTDRTFTTSVWNGLVGLAKSPGFERGAYLAAVRDFVVARLTDRPCGDMLRKSDPKPWVEALNNEIRAEIDRGNGDLRPIILEDLKPGPPAGTFKNVLWWQSPRSKEVLEALRWLNHGNRQLPDDKRFWTAEERATQEWNDRYLGLLRLLEGWKPTDEESKEDTYHMKAITYSSLASLAPPGPARVNAIRNLIAFLEQSYHDIPHRAEWFIHVRDVFTGGDQAMREEAALSRNPVIALYAAIGGSLK